MVADINMFVPKRIIFEKDAMEYEMARAIFDKFKDERDIEIINISSNKIKQNIPGEDFYALYREGKKTLVVGAKKSLNFQSCKPSAHYQLPLVSGCMGQCEYCYLNTKLGDRPFLKVHVNLNAIFEQTQKYINGRLPELTIFEGSATSDPVPVEPYTGSLKKAIEFFGSSKNAKFRFVTKYDDVDTLLDLEHNGNTEIRFSLNTASIINQYEHYTASSNKRIEASAKAAKAGYPVGFLIAPVFIYENWKAEYHNLLYELRGKLPNEMKYPVTFEVISHRYTATAKNVILQAFPETTLPMDEEGRKFKFGQFGYGKYVYEKESLDEIKRFFEQEIKELFINTDIKYII